MEVETTQKRQTSNTNFSTEALIRAMCLPIDNVITNFQREQEEQKYGTLTCWANEEAQGQFADIVNRIVQSKSCSSSSYKNYNADSKTSADDNLAVTFEPSPRYIRKLLQRYVSMVEQVKQEQIQNEELVQILLEYQFKKNNSFVVGGTKRLNDDNYPNPNEYCHLSFVMPSSSTSSDDENCHAYKNKSIVGIKVYPHHNDVGVRKVWEAGAALTEYLIQNKHMVQDQNILELGAGVGLTGLVIAGLCQTKSVHMTDYTNATLENLEHNVALNWDWIIESRKLREKDLTTTNDHDGSQQSIVTTGYLEWNDFLNKNACEESIVDPFSSYTEFQSCGNGKGILVHQPPSKSLQIASNADVLIAADVIYDRSVIPQLVQVVRTILLENSPLSNNYRNNEKVKKKIAIFAVTFRNAETFALFQKEIEKCSDEIKCDYVNSESLRSIPCIFPCYFQQDRSDVRIVLFTDKRSISPSLPPE